MPHLSAALALYYLLICLLKTPSVPFSILGGQGQGRETGGAVLDGAGGTPVSDPVQACS